MQFLVNCTWFFERLQEKYTEATPSKSIDRNNYSRNKAVKVEIDSPTEIC